VTRGVGQLTSTLSENRRDRTGGDTGPASRTLERNILKFKHRHALPLLDLTPGEALMSPPIPGKPAFQGPASRGSVFDGSVQSTMRLNQE
jgi:hypothetical protein